jgi:outer membrane protein OmpA-like peptidoglycan-associated protein
MRYVGGTLLLATILVPFAANAQSNPSVDQITRALSQPAGAKSGTPGLSITPDMLRGPTRGIMLPGSAPAAAAGGSAATKVATTRSAPASPAMPPSVGSGPEACTAGSGTCAMVIEFETGSATLSPGAVDILNSLGKALSAPSTAGFRFEVVGHTDTVGSREANLSLSEQRAQAVVAYLEAHFHIDPSRLQPIGVGKDKLLVMTPDQTPDPRNRRVQVVNVGA